ncbi:hypothetical protein AN639_02165 [Candidatus Epulonipiscium fishelsonii]|uniref:Uncharacterized protein n=1 Tax=Candidatus Epulonipiscium fishelsonii TaxID=77094 RepID=A0ACC8XET2_9FIRM|nr:hypothetical protein AN396_03135 [Epulopiscium sp. SCG-B11WGA-EpuloA1]ONI43129.1 hypothetical protein AN639_02165 [Epulopiscium sp. SCG-B05WGA-EpuloA1]
MTFEVSILTFIANSMVFIILAGVITKKIAKLSKFKDSFAYLGLKKDKNFKNNVITGFIFAAIMPFIQLISMSIVGFIVSLILEIELVDILRQYYASIAESEIGQANIIQKVMVAICMIGFVGFGEEIFFRGLLQKNLVSKYGQNIGIVITAIIFTLLHGFYMFELPIAIASATALFVVSIIFGILRAKSDSLIPSILAHGVGNAIIYTIGANMLYNLFT